MTHGWQVCAHCGPTRNWKGMPQAEATPCNRNLAEAATCSNDDGVSDLRDPTRACCYQLGEANCAAAEQLGRYMST